MRRSEIYLRAAQRVASGVSEFSCTAISLVGLSYNLKARKDYIATMAQSMDCFGRPFLNARAFGDAGTEEGIHTRIVALCLMAAIVARPKRKAKR